MEDGRGEDGRGEDGRGEEKHAFPLKMHRFKQIILPKKYNIRHNRNICPKIKGKKNKMIVK